MTAPRIAIAIPAYNAATVIGETLDGLQHNTALDAIARIVVLDDGSTDDTAAVARRHWRARPPLEIWRNAENLGERRTTNTALTRLARQVDWTLILHADDVVRSNWIALYQRELARLPDSVASICSSYDNWWPETGRIELGEEFPDRPAVHVRGEHRTVVNALERGCWWHLSGCGIRNSAFLDIGGFEPDMPQLGDWEWLLRCLSKGYGIWYLPRSTMLYRQHAGSVSARSFRIARDVRERLRILHIMSTNGYLGPSDHRALVRMALHQLGRRSLARAARGDALGFRAHASLLAEAGIGYLRDR